MINLNVTSGELLSLIGQLTVENKLLREKIAELQLLLPEPDKLEIATSA